MKLILRLSLISFLGFFLVSCGNGNPPEEISLKTTDHQLVFQGELTDKSKLNFNFENDTLKCFIRTVFVMEEDTLSSIAASLVDNDLSLKVITSPYNNVYWDDIDKLTKVHDVHFNVIGLKRGKYNIRLTINNVSSYWSDVVID